MKWRWPPWRKRDNAQTGEATETLERAQGELHRVEQQDGRVEEVSDRARDVVLRTGRFTGEVDRALRLRRTG